MTALFTLPHSRPSSASSVSFIGRSKGGKAIAKHFPMWDGGDNEGIVYYWPENGMVLFEDTRPKVPPHKRFGSMTWDEAGEHVLGISAMVYRTRHSEPWAYPNEAKKLQQFIVDMENVIRIAKEQGGPFDGEAVRRDRERRRPKSVIMPTVVEL